MTIRDASTNRAEGSAPGEVVAEEAPKPINSEKNVSAPPIPEVEITAIAEYMDIDRKEATKYAEEVQSLIEWAKRQTADHSIENLKSMIRGLELRIGTPPISEKRISYMARYAYLDMQDRKIRKEMEQFSL